MGMAAMKKTDSRFWYYNQQVNLMFDGDINNLVEADQANTP